MNSRAIFRENLPNGGRTSTGSNTVAAGGLPFGGTAGGSSGGTSGFPNISTITPPPIAGGTGTGSGTATAGSATSGAPVFSIPGIGNPSQFIRDFIGFTQTGTGALGGRGDLRPDDGGGITIVVQAPSVIDEEGFSRAVVGALNQATNRGTGGGSGIRDTAQIL